MSTINTWDRQPQETEVEWAAFRRYRDLQGPRPKLAEFAKEIGHHYAHVAGWYTNWTWAERLLGWDQHLDGKRQAVTETAVEEMARRHITLARLGQEIVQKAFNKLNADLDTEFGRLKAQEIARVLDVTTKLERLSRGEATERIEGGQDYAGLSDEDLADLERIAKKMK